MLRRAIGLLLIFPMVARGDASVGGVRAAATAPAELHFVTRWPRVLPCRRFVSLSARPSGRGGLPHHKPPDLPLSGKMTWSDGGHNALDFDYHTDSLPLGERFPVERLTKLRVRYAPPSDWPIEVSVACPQVMDVDVDAPELQWTCDPARDDSHCELNAQYVMPLSRRNADSPIRDFKDLGVLFGLSQAELAAAMNTIAGVDRAMLRRALALSERVCAGGRCSSAVAQASHLVRRFIAATRYHVRAVEVSPRVDGNDPKLGHFYKMHFSAAIETGGLAMELDCDLNGPPSERSCRLLLSVNGSTPLVSYDANEDNESFNTDHGGGTGGISEFASEGLQLVTGTAIRVR